MVLAQPNSSLTLCTEPNPSFGSIDFNRFDNDYIGRTDAARWDILVNLSIPCVMLWRSFWAWKSIGELRGEPKNTGDSKC
jgi:hypothetical protein